MGMQAPWFARRCENVYGYAHAFASGCEYVRTCQNVNGYADMHTFSQVLWVGLCTHTQISHHTQLGPIQNTVHSHTLAQTLVNASAYTHAKIMLMDTHTCAQVLWVGLCTRTQTSHHTQLGPIQNTVHSHAYTGADTCECKCVRTCQNVNGYAHMFASVIGRPMHSHPNFSPHATWPYPEYCALACIHWRRHL